ncbi:MAG: fumarylacetoacetate hydrolase [Sulfobacillus acidophilus]|uniref:Fumarylacetoacetate hydrolase n=1 Tax=Sulfobacillus acidophilus TaxID=53633 RepID=A0A2T2WJN4_9FIRM|nr:MAG: fumarylacetoacetate hydrolase [Sulfobacillus acidophilus]
MNIWAWRTSDGQPHLGISETADATKVLDVTQVEPTLVTLDDVWVRWKSVAAIYEAFSHWLSLPEPRVRLERVALTIPVRLSECWAAGVTYVQSRDARVEETQAAQQFYQDVYTAIRPELFFKAPGSRVVGPGDVMGLRRDAQWHVPEPELTVILAPGGEIFGYTAGNDLSSRDIEGVNPLYLPQAKIFHASASIGPSIALAPTVDPHALTIELRIRRNIHEVFAGSISTTEMRRSVRDLVGYLRREWPITGWTALMTGTSLVPPTSFHLQEADQIEICITDIGTLVNTVRRIGPDWVDVPEYGD